MIIIYLNALIAFLVVIFLQIMMFIRNAVPLTNGVLMSVGSSITYFVLSIFTLILLFASYESASYMVLSYSPFVITLYALIILILGILVMAIEGGGAFEAAT